MNFKELSKELNISQSKLDRICYKSRTLERLNDKSEKELRPIIFQIAVNLDFLARSYNNLSIDELISHLRKNAFMKFKEGLCKSSNSDQTLIYIEKHKRIEGKSKLIYLQNKLLFYLQDSIASASTTIS